MLENLFPRGQHRPYFLKLLPFLDSVHVGLCTVSFLQGVLKLFFNAIKPICSFVLKNVYVYVCGCVRRKTFVVRGQHVHEGSPRSPGRGVGSVYHFV